MVREPPQDQGAARQRLYVLVALADPDERDRTCGLLERLGHTAERVADGVDALARATAGGYDVVLLDVVMPGLDGLAATRAICRRFGAWRPWIVVVAAGPQEREACRDAGVDDVLGRPLTRGKLAASLARASVADGEARADGSPVEPAAGSLAEDIAAARALLERMASGDDAAFVECRDLLLDSLRQNFDRVLAAIAADDRVAVRHEAHALRGVALSAGLSGVGRLAGTVEQIGRVGETSELRVAGQRLAGQLARTGVELRALPGSVSDTRKKSVGNG